MGEFQQRAAPKVVIQPTREQSEKATEALTRVIAGAYESSIAYTNLIIVAGYAGYFAVWAQMNELMSRTEMLISALAISLSLVVFVSWEVWKMVVTSSSLHDFSAALKDPDQFESAITAAVQAEAARKVRVNRYWRIHLILTIIPALIGGTTLLYSFVRQLLGF